MSGFNLWDYVHSEISELIDWSKCGDSCASIIPTVLWAIGAGLLAHRLLSALFRRFLFRRVPLWEIVLQNLLFIWMVIYSIHFWNLLVKILKVLITFFYDDDSMSTEETETRKMMLQWVIWMCGMLPLAFYIHTQPRPENPPLMIWITTSPWMRREMGPYGYYLNRPLSSLQSSTNVANRRQVLTLRRAFSDSKVVLKEPAKKKRHSKSV
ncbi:uncharacterized protein LOC113236008 [Hyposmocoma kahamanoa]|uniref:uncharacterized protein LOC113236008 n=1 Tax=Hyposmocoma kahamanoa TaxID=1477025 RepID=UPI000E6D8430|nr:uncharacterized protein LOC113236008 [Hyposmocoma kahamanoa]